MFAVGGTLNIGKIIHNDGNGWVVQSIPSVRVVNDVIGFTPGDVFAVGRGPSPGFDGIVLRYDGSSWSKMLGTLSVGTGGSYYSIWGTSGSDLYALGWDGTKAVLHRFDGTAWSDAMLPPPPVRSFPGDIWGSSGTDIWVVAAERDVANKNVSGVIYHYDGSAWSVINPPSTTALYAVGGSDSCNVVAGGTFYDGTAYNAVSLSYDGNTWSSSTSALSENVAGLWSGAVNKSLYVGSGSGFANGKFGVDDGAHGVTWSAATPNLWIPHTAFRIPGTDTLYVIGDGNSAARLAYTSCN